MRKIIMLQGLPASGKSTWAKDFVLQNQDAVRVNKDELRAMLHAGHWSKLNEQQVLITRDQIIEESLDHGKIVIVDDTNFAPKHEVRLKELAKKHRAAFELLYFGDDTPEHLAECIKRDLARPNSVGEGVIRQMYHQYVKPKEEGRTQLVPLKTGEEELPHAVIFDIDGTLACIGDRSPYDGKSCAVDLPNTSIITLNQAIRMHGALRIILFSGRSDDSEMETREWLKKHGVSYHELHMRAAGDTRKDSTIKQEMFDCFVRNKYTVEFVVDDRNQVVDMWRKIGLVCLQVAPGDF